MTWETFFSWKIIHKMWWKSSPRPFSENQNWACLWINSLKFESLVILYVQVEGYQNILKLRYRPLFLPHIIPKTKRGLELFSLPHFLHKFWRNIFLTRCSITWTNFSLLIVVTSWEIRVLWLLVIQVVTL